MTVLRNSNLGDGLRFENILDRSELIRESLSMHLTCEHLMEKNIKPNEKTKTFLINELCCFIHDCILSGNEDLFNEEDGLLLIFSRAGILSKEAYYSLIDLVKTTTGSSSEDIWKKFLYFFNIG